VFACAVLRWFVEQLILSSIFVAGAALVVCYRTGGYRSVVGVDALSVLSG
jgi:hypothetical protein